MSRFNLLTKLVVIFILLLVFTAYFPHQTRSTEVGGEGNKMVSLFVPEEWINRFMPREPLIFFRPSSMNGMSLTLNCRIWK